MLPPLTLHQAELGTDRWHVVTEPLCQFVNKSRARSFETRYRSRDFWGYWAGRKNKEVWIADEPSNYITSRGEE